MSFGQSVLGTDSTLSLDRNSSEWKIYNRTGNTALNPCQVRQHTDLRIARGGERRQAEIAESSSRANRPLRSRRSFAREPHGSGVPLRRRRGVRGLGPSEKYSQDGWKEDQVPWLSWQPALILPLLFYCAAPPSPSRSLVIAAPPSSLASSYLLSRTPPHPRPSPSSTPLLPLIL